MICMFLLLRRNVQSILKSPELDAKYEKFASNASPKTSRKKFLSSRQPAKRKRKTSASSKTRASTASAHDTASVASTAASRNSAADPHGGHSANSQQQNAVEAAMQAVNDHFVTPKEIAAKYFVGDIVGTYENQK